MSDPPVTPNIQPGKIDQGMGKKLDCEPLFRIERTGEEVCETPWNRLHGGKVG